MRETDRIGLDRHDLISPGIFRIILSRLSFQISAGDLNDAVTISAQRIVYVLVVIIDRISPGGNDIRGIIAVAVLGAGDGKTALHVEFESIPFAVDRAL